MKSMRSALVAILLMAKFYRLQGGIVLLGLPGSATGPIQLLNEAAKALKTGLSNQMVSWHHIMALHLTAFV